MRPGSAQSEPNHDARLAADENRLGQHLDDSWWAHVPLDPADWSRAYPYQLQVVKKERDGSYTVDGRWLYTLPLPPRALRITMPFASSVEATLGGIVEENGGAPFRDIVLQASGGSFPLRGSAPRRQRAGFQGILAGTIAAAGRVQASGQTLLGLRQQNLVSEEQVRGQAGKASGYWSWHTLQQFLEAYAALKRTRDGAPYRLVLSSWKDRAHYVITPQMFSTSRDASSPLEYAWSLQARAWRRIRLDSAGPQPDQYEPATRSPDAMSRILRGLQDARRTLQDARNALAAIGADLDRILFEPLRQTVLFLKEAAGVPTTLLDMPVEFLRGARDAVLLAVSVQEQDGLGERAFQNSEEIRNILEDFRALGSLIGRTDAQVSTIRAIDPGQIDSSPAGDLFRNPDRYLDLLEAVGVRDLQLDPPDAQAVRDQQVAARSIRRLDFERWASQVREASDAYADLVGVGDETYRAQYSRAAGTKRRDATDQDWAILHALEQAEQDLLRLAASPETERLPGAVDALVQLRPAGREPRSKFAVPFPHGATLEQLARRYLGDPDRWPELAALNGLQPPYVDEEGVDLPILIDGVGSTLVVDASPDAVERIRPGAVALAWSDQTPPTTRRIASARRAGDRLEVELSGDPDLDRFRVGSHLRVYRPGTINSQQLLYVPSDLEPAESDYLVRGRDGLELVEAMTRAGGIDLQLTQANDLIVTPDGDSPLAVGLACLIQVARLRLELRRGALIWRPTIGLPVEVGDTLADVDLADINLAVQDMFADEPALAGVRATARFEQGTGVRIQLDASLAGVPSRVPLAVDLPTR